MQTYGDVEALPPELDEAQSSARLVAQDIEGVVGGEQAADGGERGLEALRLL